MRILRWLLAIVVGVILAVTAASVVYNLATSDPNVSVHRLWHGRFEHGTAYRQWGSQGPAVVLLGGFLEPTFVWDDVGPLLAHGFRVYALDLDGFGYSQRRGPYTLAHWGDQVQRFISALNLGHPIVVGHSLGAAVAVEEARRGIASGVVLVDGDALRNVGPPHWLATALVHAPFFTTLYRVLLHSNWAVRKILSNAYGPVHPAFDAAELHRWTDPFRAQGARQALQRIAENGIPGFTPAQLRAMNVHGVVIWGGADTVDSESAGRQTARDLRLPFVVLPGAGHLSMPTAADRIARAIARMG